MNCIFSPDRIYRYTLWRKFEIPLDLFDGVNDGERGYRPDSYVQFIGLNPSTADEQKNDPTIRRCIAFAQRWGFSRLVMTNLFAYRATDPDVMKAQPEPIGQENDMYLASEAANAGLIICAWGKHGSHRNRAQDVIRLLEPFKGKLHALKVNADGSPMHPLYIDAETVPIRYAI